MKKKNPPINNLIKQASPRPSPLRVGSGVRGQKKPPYKIFNHTADVGFDVYGATRKELFSHAAVALFDLFINPDSIDVKEERPITISGADIHDLWINYLRELLYLFNGNAFLLRRVDILKIDKNSLSMIVKGEPLNPDKHEILTEIKAVTYHLAEVNRTRAGWEGRFVVDV